MHVEAEQDDVYIVGGDGGEAPQHDGRGGRGAAPRMIDWDGPEYLRRSRMKLPYDAPNIYFGRGGDSADTPQYKARRLIVEQLKTKYYERNGLIYEGYDIWYDRTNVPLEWINDELKHSHYGWGVVIEDDEYVFFD